MSGSGISWAICKSAPCSRQITTPAPHYSVLYRPDALPAAQPTASKHWRQLSRWKVSKITTSRDCPTKKNFFKFIGSRSMASDQLQLYPDTQAECWGRWVGGERKGETERVRGKGMGHKPDQVWEEIDAPEYDYSYWYSYIATITDTTTVIIALLFQFFNLNSLLLLMPAHKRNRPQQLQHFLTGWMPYLSRSPNRSLSKHLR